MPDPRADTDNCAGHHQGGLGTQSITDRGRHTAHLRLDPLTTQDLTNQVITLPGCTQRRVLSDRVDQGHGMTGRQLTINKGGQLGNLLSGHW